MNFQISLHSRDATTAEAMALLQQLELLLAQMLSPENEVRSPAEKQYEQIALDQKGTLLFQVYLNPSAKPEVRRRRGINLSFGRPHLSHRCAYKFSLNCRLLSLTLGP